MVVDDILVVLLRTIPFILTMVMKGVVSSWALLDCFGNRYFMNIYIFIYCMFFFSDFSDIC